MAFHKKWQALLSLNPDIAILPECAAHAILKTKCPEFLPTSFEWIGENRQKGLGIATFGGYQLRTPFPLDPSLKWSLPLEVLGPCSFNLLAVWAKHDETFKSRSEQGPAIKSVIKYTEFLSRRDSVIAGDFNNNSIWDKKGKANNHQNLIDLLMRLGRVSAYHHLTGEAFGQETKPTLYWRDRKEDGPKYHIDYCFMPTEWANSTDLQVGSFDAWVAKGLSDHVPLLVKT